MAHCGGRCQHKGWEKEQKGCRGGGWGKRECWVLGALDLQRAGPTLGSLQDLVVFVWPDRRGCGHGKRENERET